MKCHSHKAMTRLMALFTAACMLLMAALMLFTPTDTLAASVKDGAAKPNSGKVDTKTGDDKGKTTPKPAEDKGKGNATPEDKGNPKPDTTKPGNSIPDPGNASPGNPNPGNDKASPDQGNSAPGSGNAGNSNPATPKPANPAPGNSDQGKGNSGNSNGNNNKPVNTTPATSKPINGNSGKGNSSGNNGNGSPGQGNAGKITLCHATGSDTNPFVEITVSVNAAGPDAVAGHTNHADDIIPVPAGGCPQGTKEKTAHDTPGKGKDQPDNGTQGDNNPGNDNQNGKISLCHATGSAKHPYVFITVSKNAAGPDAVAGHTKHADDIIPAGSLADCPITLPEDEANNPGNGNDNPSNGGGNKGGNDNEKIGLCHATGSATNPYVFIVVSVNAAGPDAVAGHSKHADDIIPANSSDDCPQPASGGTNPGDTTGGNNPGDPTGGNPGSYNPGDGTSGGNNPVLETGNPPAQLPGTVGGSSPQAPAGSTPASGEVAPAESTSSQEPLVVANIPASDSEQPSAVLGAVQAPAQISQPQALAPAFFTLQPVGVGVIPGLPNTGSGFLANLKPGNFNFANQGLISWITILGLVGLLAVVAVIEFSRLKSKAKAKK